jgi:hypothetical protein
MRSGQWTGERLSCVAAIAAILAFLTGLGLFAYAGTYSRFWADDYCYSAAVKQFGLLPGLVDWYHTSGNRFSTLVVVAFSDLFGHAAIRYVPLAVLAAWAGAWVFFLRGLRRLLAWNVQIRWLVLLALVEVYFAVLLAPDRTQALYWRMGTFHYTLPAAVLLANLGLLARCFRRSCRHSGWIALAGGLLGFFAAGLSETFAALQAVLFLIGLLAALAFLRGQGRSHTARLLLAPLVGTLLMMLLMMSAPANAWRQAVMPPPENLLSIFPYALRYAAEFLFYTIRGQVLPLVVYAAGVSAVTLLAVPRAAVRISPRWLMGACLLSLLLMYVLIAASFAPSAYAALSYPAGRALMPACVVMVAGLGLAAGCAACALREWLPADARVWIPGVSLAVLALFCLYLLRSASIPLQDAGSLAVRAQRWDARDAQVLEDLRKGVLDVQVRQVDVVQGLEDIGPDATHWINACAAVFYGAHFITASP